MSVREFDGTDDRIIVDDGGYGTTGAISMFVVLKPADIPNSDEGVMAIRDASGSPNNAILYTNTGNIFWGSDSADSFLSAGLTASAWQVIGLDKAAGTTTPRMHRKPLGSGSWTHGNGSTTAADGAGTNTQIDFGQLVTGSGYRAMRLAFAAIWQTQLSDADYEALEAAATTADVVNYSTPPFAAWDFNQDTVADDVLDLIGTCDETSITGTTVVTSDDPAWTFGLGGPTGTPILDSFDRADETPLSGGGNWAGPVVSGNQQCGLVSNRASGHASGDAQSYWTAGTSWESQEVWTTIGAFATETSIIWRVSGAGGSDNLYLCTATPAGTAMNFWKRTAGSWSSLLDTASFSYAVGDSYGIVSIGSSHEVWHKPAAGAWTLKDTWTDATHASGSIGMYGVGAASRYTEFGGGSLDVVVQELRPDADTTTTGWTSTPLWSKINDSSDASVITATLS